MKNETEQKTPFFINAAESPYVRGFVLGAGVMTGATPFLKWTNCVCKGEKMPRHSHFSGAGAYALSAVPGYVTTFLFKAMLNKKPEETTPNYELFSSFIAGSFSGFVCTPFEALAQNKQLSGRTSSTAIMQQMRTHNGYGSFFRGAASIMMREGMWSTVYMTAIPMMSALLQKQRIEKFYADYMAVLTVAGAYGLLTSPLNQLRFQKQDNLTKKTPNKSYLEHIKAIYGQDQKANHLARIGFFFRAGVPRMATTTVAAGLMVKGTECYDRVVDSFKS